MIEFLKINAWAFFAGWIIGWYTPYKLTDIRLWIITIILVVLVRWRVA